MADPAKTKLIIKCIDFYVTNITKEQTICPSINDMREIVQLDDIKSSLVSSKSESPKSDTSKSS